MVNPEIKLFGGIYDIPEATVKPLKDLDYKIIIDLNSGSESSEKLNPALNNVARMINLHVIGGASAENIEVVLAIHGDANDVVMKEVEIATSMLTTVTTHQLQGYVFLSF